VAQRVTVEIIDDIDGTQAAETIASSAHHASCPKGDASDDKRSAGKFFQSYS
jgi:hypothetical protein